MLRRLPPLLLLLAALAGFAGCTTYAPYRAPSLPATLTAVHDGDTVTLLVETAPGKKESLRVRLWGIDAPELDQPYGPEARDHLAALIGLEARVEIVARDVAGSVVGRVYWHAMSIPEPTDLGEVQVRAGLAWWHRDSTRSGPEAKVLSTLQAEARKAKKGLWADRKPVPPWEFREQARGAGTTTKG